MTNSSRFLLALSGLFTLVAFTPAAHADLAPETPPECQDRPPNTPCIRFDGTAGICIAQTDARRPGRSYASCEPDPHECDRLAVGATCHGYLGHPSHCRAFVDDRTHRPWRACVADGTPSSAPPAAAASPAPPQHPRHVPLSMAQCAVRNVGVGTSGSAAGALWTLASVRALRRRRSRRARS